MNQIDVFLLSTPNRNIDYPALSIPSLYSSLNNDFRVEQCDLNISIRDKLFSFEVLNSLKNHILPELIYRYSTQQELLLYFVKLYNFLLDIDKVWRLENIEKIKLLMQRRKYNEIIKDKEGADGIQALFKLNRMMHLFIEFYASNKDSLSDLFTKNMGYDPIEQILDNLYAKIMESQAVIVGFSVLEIQRAFTLMVINDIKKVSINGKMFGGYIVVGGADPTRYKEKYLEYFEAIDFVSLYEGEENFSQLVGLLISGSKDYYNVKNIVFRDGDKIVSTYDKNFVLDPAKISTPSFQGYEIDKYLVPALPIHASRACYYAFGKKNNCLACSLHGISCGGAPDMQGCELGENGCNFCVHYKTYSNYIERDASGVVDDLEKLNNEYGVRLFHFTDDALKPELGAEISDEIIKRGLTNIRWLVYARFESEFNETILRKWFNAGARVIEWGLESASQNVIDHMNKNINMSDVSRILRISSQIGFLNKLFVFHNHPSETVVDLRKTLDFLMLLSKNEQIRLFPVIRNKMFLLKGTTLYENWEKFYLKVWRPSAEFGITAEYLENEPYQPKAEMIEEFMREIHSLMKTRMIYSTDDENVMFDLLTIQLNEEGNIAYYQCI